MFEVLSLHAFGLTSIQESYLNRT